MVPSCTRYRRVALGVSSINANRLSRSKCKRGGRFLLPLFKLRAFGLFLLIRQQKGARNAPAEKYWRVKVFIKDLFLVRGINEIQHDHSQETRRWTLTQGMGTKPIFREKHAGWGLETDGPRHRQVRRDFVWHKFPATDPAWFVMAGHVRRMVA